MKKIFVLIIVIALLAGGYFMFIKKDAPAESQAKIDPRIACESALSYMTFPSSLEADQFVQSCIDGDHPDVIERYIKEQGYSEASI